MNRKYTFTSFFLILFVISIACSRHTSGPDLRVEIPAGFSGNFVLDMGVHGAPPLEKDGDNFVIRVPRDGKLQTSTVLEKPAVTFQNAGSGGIWGFSQRNFTTGDGISTGGKIEFFVGSQKEFEAEQKKKNKSGFFRSGSASAGA